MSKKNKNKNKKYKLLKDDVIWIDNKKLYRIQALKSFSNIDAGDLGGYIEKESNLSHSGDCWVYDNARVYENAKVLNDAVVYDNARVYGEARISNNSQVYDNAKVYGNASIFGYALVYRDSTIYGNAMVYDNAEVYGHARIFNDAIICDYADVCGCAEISGWAKIASDAFVTNCKISKTAIIYDNGDYVVLKGFGRENRSTTFFKLLGGNIGVECGCFSGTLNEFKKKVKQTHPIGSKYRKEYLSLIKSVKIHFGI